MKSQIFLLEESNLSVVWPIFLTSKNRRQPKYYYLWILTYLLICLLSIRKFYSEWKVFFPEIRNFLDTQFICILTFSYVLNHWCEHPKFSLDFLLDFKDFIVSIFFCLWWAGSMIFSLRIFWASSSTWSFWLVWKN